MCGRYALNISGEDLALEFAAGIKDAAFTPSNWNISPTTLIPFINGEDESGDKRSINTASWGLIPAWAKDASRAGLVIKRVCQWLPTVSSSIYLHLFHMQGDLDAHRPQCHENVIKNLFSLS